jgi:hypothetical protein
MTKRSILTGFVVTTFVLGVLILSLAAQAPQGAAPQGAAPQGGAPPQAGAPAQAGAGRGGGQRGPAGPPAPCGPKASLPAEQSQNVAPNARCYEIRMYTADRTRDGVGNFKGGINELHQRFREKEVALFQKHGAEIIAVWQHLGDPDTLVWMLAYRDRAHREEVWAAFGKDPEWLALQKKYFVPLKTNTFMMSTTDYSPMK